MTIDVRRAVARVRGPMIPLGILLVLVGFLLSLGWLGIAGGVLIVAGLAFAFVPTEQPDRAPIPVQAPVRGRWIAVNSPADKVPSHGTRELGQAYAIDLVYAPDPEVDWQGVYRWPPARRPSAFPGFGQPILAPLSGTVVTATGWQRDHWSRNSLLGLFYLFPEMVLRSLLSALGGHFVLGNHIVLDCGDGGYAVLAHLKRGSLRVRRGERVQAGDHLADCGNSGNSSEPHLHFHLMDHHRPVVAAGLPFQFARYEVAGQSQSGVPGNSRPFVVSP